MNNNGTRHCQKIVSLFRWLYLAEYMLQNYLLVLQHKINLALLTLSSSEVWGGKTWITPTDWKCYCCVEHKSPRLWCSIFSLLSQVCVPKSNYRTWILIRITRKHAEKAEENPIGMTSNKLWAIYLMYVVWNPSQEWKTLAVSQFYWYRACSLVWGDCSLSFILYSSALESFLIIENDRQSKSWIHLLMRKKLPVPYEFLLANFFTSIRCFLVEPLKWREKTMD